MLLLGNQGLERPECLCFAVHQTLSLHSSCATPAIAHLTDGETEVSAACPYPTVANLGPTLGPCCSQTMSLRDIFRGCGPVVVVKIQRAEITAPFAGASWSPSTTQGDRNRGSRLDQAPAMTPAILPSGKGKTPAGEVGYMGSVPPGSSSHRVLSSQKLSRFPCARC